MSISGVSNYSSYSNCILQQQVNQENEKKARAAEETKSTIKSSTTSNYKNLSDYTKYLSKTYSYYGKQALVSGVPTSVSVSNAFLSKCVKDPEKAKYLEENLGAINESVSRAKAGSLGKLVDVSYCIDDHGNISMSTTSISGDGSGTVDHQKKESREKQIQQKKEKRELEKAREKKRREKKEKDKVSEKIDSYFSSEISENTGNLFNIYK